MILTELLIVKGKKYDVYVQDCEKCTTLFMPRIETEHHTIEHELLMYVGLAHIAKHYKKGDKVVIIQRNNATIDKCVVTELIPGVEIEDGCRFQNYTQIGTEKFRCLFVSSDIMCNSIDVITNYGNCEDRDILINFIPLYDNSLMMIGDYCDSGIVEYLHMLSFKFDMVQDINVDRLVKNLVNISIEMKSGLYPNSSPRVDQIITSANKILVAKNEMMYQPIHIVKKNGRFINNIVFKAINSGEELKYMYIDPFQRSFIKKYFTDSGYTARRINKKNVVFINDTLFYYIKDIHMLGPELASHKLLNLMGRTDIDHKHIYNAAYTIGLDELTQRKLFMEDK